MKEINYYYRGSVERPNKKGSYEWKPGYSKTGPNGGVEYPWMTVKECIEEAKKEKAIASFVEEEK